MAQIDFMDVEDQSTGTSDNKGAPVKGEKFDIVFMAMGQGDCTLVRCPDGQVVMIDCGSKADFEPKLLTSARQILRDKDWAGATGQIEAVILTHPDQDHYKTLTQVLYETIDKSQAAVAVNRLFFSLSACTPLEKERPEEKPVYILDRYRMGGVCDGLYDGTLKVNEAIEVTITESAQHYRLWKQQAGLMVTPKNSPDPVNLPGKKLEVLKGKTKAGKDWSVTILAGNVKLNKATGDTATPNNAASLVTLIQFDTSKALICGDATVSTEAFLTSTHAGLLQNIDLIQVPHHGSETSSGQTFVTLTNPRFAVVSVGFMEHVHYLPRYVALKPWLEVLDAHKKTTDSHHIDYWSAEEESTVAKQREEWEKNSNIFKLWGEKSFRWLDPIVFDNAYWAFAYDYMLFREAIDLPLWQTSTLKDISSPFIPFTLPLT